MIIVEKNEGPKIPYSVKDTKVTFDDDLTLNLASREQDWPVHIDICFDNDNALVIGAAAGRAYVAQIDIPARQYEEVETGNGATEGGEGEEAQRVPVALDMDTVT
ncbi:MAG: hypothetical protein GX825_03500, partial [Syntrophomonadaceae bacterium]|nr:hypothetical protein [Syntrophomonadaceae bacterium]